MIIELFGAPGAGKTTFASALATELRELGQCVEVIQSYRPAESARSVRPVTKNRFGHRSMDGLRRIARATAEIVPVANPLRGASQAVEVTATLLRVLPPRNILWSMRLRQYMLRLFASWERALSTEHIVVFDQGFIQAVCSFVLLSGTSDQALVRRALQAIPQSDRSILVVAPPDVLRARLEERYRLQGRFEQLLELTIDENIRSAAITDAMFQMLRHSGNRVIEVDASDSRSGALAAEKLISSFLLHVAAGSP